MSQHAELIAQANERAKILNILQHGDGTLFALLADALQAMERKPMTDDKIIEIGNEMHRAMSVGSDDQDELLAIVRAIEAFHGIQPPKDQS